MKVVQLFRDPMRASVAFAVLYVLLITLLPANKELLETYNVTSAQYRILMLIVVLPYIAIWFLALRGYSRLRSYAKLIHKSPEGEHFQYLAKGVCWLAYGLPIAAIVSTLLSAVANQVLTFHATAIIINNYLSLIIPLVGFIFIARAANGLATKADIKTSVFSSRLLVLIFMTLGVLYCYFTFRHFDLGSITSTANPYFLPIWLMLVSLIIPFLYTWFIGLLAAYELILHSWQSQGVLYKQAIQFLSCGLVIVIVSFIALQYVNTILPRDGSLTVSSILILVYALRLIMAAGFVSIAYGANKLKRIEEV